MRLLTGLFCLLALTINPAHADTQSREQLINEAEQLTRLHGFVVIQDDHVVLDVDVRGADNRTPVNIKSVSKSVLSLLTGMAIHQGYLDSIEQPIAPLLGRFQIDHEDPRFEQITIEHLLTMQSGLESTSGRNYGRWVAQDNWTKYALSRPIVAEPGTRMIYSTGNSHILAALLTEVTGQSLHALAQEWLGETLRIQIPPWLQSPEGVFFGGNDMYLSARALAHIGRIYLNGGKVNEHQFIAADWIQNSFSPRTQSVFSDDPYGLGWFYYTFSLDGESVEAWYGRGFGGQMLYIIPSLNVSIAMISSPNPPSSGQYTRQIHQFVESHLLPSLVSSNGAAAAHADHSF